MRSGMFDKRAAVISTIVLFGFFMVIVRLADIMVIDHESYTRKARALHTVEKTVETSRGPIYDRRGRELAVNVECASLSARPRKIEDPAAVASALAPILGIGEEALTGKLRSESPFVWIDRKVELEAARSIAALDIEGLELTPTLRRYYPEGELTSHVIGFVGVDNQGLEALEYYYDKTLRRPAGRVSVFRDARGRTLSAGLETHRPGYGLVLTIEEGLQYIVESELERAVSKWNASHASAIMMNPYNGEILAMANYPTYDLNSALSAPVSHRRNRAVTDVYEPGSTFKLVTAAAALEEGTARPDDILDVSEGKIEAGPLSISDAHKAELLSFRQVIQQSSNVGAVKLGLKLGKERLLKWARSFGFGEATGIDLPGEAEGWIQFENERPEASTAALSIGYGVAATPLQILRAYSAVANGGWLPSPHVIREVRDHRGSLVREVEPALEGPVISKQTAETLRSIFVSVLDDEGTASQARVEGSLAAGKTGTTRLWDKELGSYSTERYVSSFVGFAPALRPEAVLIVVVNEPEEAYYGGAVAAPVFSRIMERSLAYLTVPSDRQPALPETERPRRRWDTSPENVLVMHTEEM